MDDPAYLAARTEDGDPGDLEEYEDLDNVPPTGLDDSELDALIAEARENDRAVEAAAGPGQTGLLAAVAAVVTGRRGPGMPGSAESFPSEHASPAAGFASGMPLDVAPGCVALGSFLEDAAGTADRYPGVSDDELAGVICAWDRVQAHASARKHTAVAELIRRRAAPGCGLEGPMQMPADWAEFTGRELGAVLGLSAREAEAMLGLADELEVREIAATPMTGWGPSGERYLRLVFANEPVERLGDLRARFDAALG